MTEARGDCFHVLTGEPVLPRIDERLQKRRHFSRFLVFSFAASRNFKAEPRSVFEGSEGCGGYGYDDFKCLHDVVWM